MFLGAAGAGAVDAGAGAGGGAAAAGQWYVQHSNLGMMDPI